MKKTRIAFGTVVRNAPVDEAGELVLLDWETKTVSASTRIFPQNPSMSDDENPRGNTRGCKGVEVVGDRIIAADFHTLNFFDLALQPVRQLSHGLMVGLHEINHDEERDSIWVASTVIDAAVEYQRETGEMMSKFSPRTMHGISAKLGLEPGKVDWSADNRRAWLSGNHLKSHSHLHLNAVIKHRGQVYSLFHAHGAICNLSDDKVIIQDDRLKKGHNLRFVEQEVVAVNDTFGRTIRFYDTSERRLVREIDLMQFDWVKALCARAERKNLAQKLLNRLRIGSGSISRPIFVRGMDVHGSKMYVGLSPAAIVCVDWTNGELLDAYQYSDDPQACVHGLRVFEH